MLVNLLCVGSLCRIFASGHIVLSSSFLEVQYGAVCVVTITAIKNSSHPRTFAAGQLREQPEISTCFLVKLCQRLEPSLINQDICCVPRYFCASLCIGRFHAIYICCLLHPLRELICFFVFQGRWSPFVTQRLWQRFMGHHGTQSLCQVSVGGCLCMCSFGKCYCILIFGALVLCCCMPLSCFLDLYGSMIW